MSAAGGGRADAPHVIDVTDSAVHGAGLPAPVRLELPSSRAVGTGLAGVVVVLVGLGAVASLLERSSLEIAGRENIITLLSLKSEFNIPTVVSALLLAGAGVLLVLLSAVQRARGQRYVRHWALLGAVFVYLALDEGARLHERLNEPLDALPITTGVFRWGWVLVGIAVVLVLGAVYARFVVALPSPERTGVVVAAVLYVSGALLMELAGAGVSESSGLATPLYLAMTMLEETLELTGISLFIVTLWTLLRRWAPALLLQHPASATVSRRAPA